MIAVTRVTNFLYQYDCSTEQEISIVEKILTLKEPDAWFISQRVNYEYDGLVRLYNKDRQFGHGLLQFLIDGLARIKMTCLVNDFIFTKHPLPLSTTLHLHQGEAVKIAYLKRFGIIKVPTRGGKTYIAAELIRQIQGDIKNPLGFFIVDNKTLFTQSVKEISSFLKIPESDIGVIKQGKINLKEINVVMIQTLQVALSTRNKDLKKKRELLKFMSSLEWMIVDEIHEFSSSKRLSIIKKAKNLQFLISLSATPFRQNAFIDNFKLKSYVGDIIYEISEKILVERKILSENGVCVLYYKHEKVKMVQVDVDEYDFYLDTLIHNNKQRDEVLVLLLEILERLGIKVLVFFSNIAHGKRIESITGHKFIYGNTKEQERESVKVDYLKRKGGTLLTSNIFKKGITLPSVEVMINVDAGLEETNVIQKRGRVLGTSEGKTKALIIDFIDVFKNNINEHSLNRLDLYEELVGVENMRVVEVGSENYLKDFEEIIRDWFSII